VNGTSIGDARFEPFFAAAEKMGRRDLRACAGPRARTARRRLCPEQAVCFPGDIDLPAPSMITGGIASGIRSCASRSARRGVMSILLARLVHA